MQLTKKKYLLTDAEREVMEYIWTSDEPLSGNDILEKSPFKEWSSGYLHNVLRSMLKKKVIQVEGLVQSNTQYARTFAPALTREEYAAQMAMSVGGVVNQKSIAKVAMAMAKEAGSEDLIRKLEALIEESK